MQNQFIQKSIRQITSQLVKQTPKFNFQGVQKQIKTLKYINCYKTQIVNTNFSKFQFSTSGNQQEKHQQQQEQDQSEADYLSKIQELQANEKKFMEIYNKDIFMLNHKEGFPLIEQIIQQKQQLYRRNDYTNWLEDTIIKIQYLYHREQNEEAQTLTKQVLSQFSEDNNENYIQKARILERLAVKVSTFVSFDEGIISLKEAIEWFEKSENSEISEYRAHMYKLLAGLQEKNAQYEPAFESYEKTGNIYNALIKQTKIEEPEQRDHYAKLQSLCYSQFSRLCQNLQFYNEAQTLITAAFNIWNTIEGSPENMKSLDYIRITKQIGELSLEQGNYEVAYSYLTLADKALQNNGGINKENASLISAVKINIGRFYFQIHNYEKSQDYTEQAEKIMKEFPLLPTDICQILEQKVTIQYMRKQNIEGLQTIQDGLRVCQMHNKYDYYYLKFLYFQGLIYQSQTEFEQAEKTGEQLLKDAKSLYGDDSEHVADGLRVIAHAKLSQNGDNIDECLKQIKQAGNIYATIGPKTIDYMYCLEDTIRYAQDYDRFEAARDACVDLKVIRKEIMTGLKQSDETIEKELEMVELKIVELNGKIALQEQKKQSESN